MFLCSKLKNGLCKVVTKFNVTKSSTVHLLFFLLYNCTTIRWKESVDLLPNYEKIKVDHILFNRCQ